MDKSRTINIIGGGLAGSEAAYRAARRGYNAVIYEMKPVCYSPAHTLETLGELVCSNSLKSTDVMNASGLLKEEMRLLDSLVIKAAEATRVPAGGSLAVDRVAFSRYVTDALTEMGVKIVRGEVRSIPAASHLNPLIIATGPLTSQALSAAIIGLAGGKKSLYFYDAVSPVVYKDSIDMGKAFMASRYGKGGADYINCPFNKEQYRVFVKELVAADFTRLHEFEGMPLFEGCLPIEAMAQRGEKTLMFGPMKPVGLVDPATKRRPYAVVQLRKENIEGALYNMVGFQTRLTYPEQKRVFRLIPGLERAQFARLGKMHRNTYIDSPRLLTNTQQLKSNPAIFFAGQITGVEGYCESAASGLIAGVNAIRLSSGELPVCPPPTTIIGALLDYTARGGVDFQPMNANFGLIKPAESGSKNKEKRRADLIERALKDIAGWSRVYLATS